jgi:uncharacterized Zn finger protein
MSELPQLTEADIRRWTGDESFRRGQRYFGQDAILNPCRVGMTLKAHCQGSRSQPYRVQITLGPKGMASGNCSCPVGGSGHCKHAAALLLTWLNDADAFVDVEDMATTLDRRSKPELIDLIGKMVERYPDLELLVELPVPGEATSKPVDAESIRRQIQRVFSSAGYEWGTASEVAVDLGNVVDVGDGYVEQEDWRNAVIVYETVMREVLDQYPTLQDEEGDLNEVVNRCVGGLGQCLSETEDPAQRETILRALFDTYMWDVNFGGIDMGYEAPGIILEQSTPEQRRLVAGWVRSAMPTSDSWSHDYHRQILGRFLLELEKDELDDEAFLRICRETGRWLDLVDRLLALKRVDEAADVARSAGDYDLLRLADVFVAHGQADLATELMRTQAKASQDTRLPEWLKQCAMERGDSNEALAWAQQLYWRRPSSEGYEQVKALSQSLGTWETLHIEILSRLSREKQHTLLTEIYLKEGQVDRALESVKRVTTGMWGMYQPALSIQVAQAAEPSHPQESIRIYVDAARESIQARGRDNYTMAAKYLSRVRKLYRRLGEDKTWQALIADIRQQNSSLRALKEELSKVGL